jgi:dCTP deaminase
VRARSAGSEDGKKEMILTGPEIKEQIRLGNIEINPYVSENVNPASVDLTLGDDVVTYTTLSEMRGDNGLVKFLDSKREYHVEHWHVPPAGFLIRPGQLYLMHTVERVCAKRFVPVLDGKSSIGRLGVCVHLTAGFGDPGFDGQYTLEVTCVLPVRLYAGMRIAQMRFHAVQGVVEDYKRRGNYVGERATGPVASQSWRQFK